MIKVFGLKNCDSCRKALKWLELNCCEFHFIDLREKDFDLGLVELWVRQVGWESLINRRSLTWRNLPDEETKKIDVNRAIRLMRKNPTLMKRPICELGGKVYIGFKDDQRKLVKATM